MFSFLRRHRLRKLERQYAARLEHARDVQRSGDLRAYAELVAEIEKIGSRIDEARAAAVAQPAER